MLVFHENSELFIFVSLLITNIYINNMYTIEVNMYIKQVEQSPMTSVIQQFAPRALDKKVLSSVPGRTQSEYCPEVISLLWYS